MKPKKRVPVTPILPLLILGLCFVMLISSILLPDQSFSQTENRPLAVGADLSVSSIIDGSGQEDLNAWFSDQIPLRDTFFHLNYFFRDLFGQREIDDVFLGHDALLANPDEPKAGTAQGNAQSIASFADKSGLGCYVMIVPSAASIQSSKLPMNAPVRSVQSEMDAAYAALGNAHPVNVTQIMTENAGEYIYYKTDHHWTTKGAGLGSKTLLEAMGFSCDLNGWQIMPVSNTFEGTLASKTGSFMLKDQVDIAVASNNPQYVVTWADGSKTGSIYDITALDQKDQYELFLGTNQSIVRIETDADSERSLLLFKDSYANSMIQYLLPYFHSITIIDPRYYYDDLSIVLTTAQITDAAFVYSADTFNTISSLQDVLNSYNPS